MTEDEYGKLYKAIGYEEGEQSTSGVPANVSIGRSVISG